MDNPGTQATLDTRCRTRINKSNTAHRTKKMSNWTVPKGRGCKSVISASVSAQNKLVKHNVDTLCFLQSRGSTENWWRTIYRICLQCRPVDGISRVQLCSCYNKGNVCISWRIFNLEFALHCLLWSFYIVLMGKIARALSSFSSIRKTTKYTVKVRSCVFVNIRGTRKILWFLVSYLA